VPSRKQRRRRQKSFRHDYEFVLLDEEGNEVEVDPAELRAEKEKARPERSKGRATTRTGRTIEPASWRRVGKRALIFAPLMFVAVSVLDKQLTVLQHAAQTLTLLAFFLPFSYAMDTVAYRMYLRRTGQLAANEPKKRRQLWGRSPR
jgi:cytochrome c-type biogenesis protein CcmH/NrfG